MESSENLFHHENFIFQAGIDSGYQEKPCLNPHDPNCPRSAPNKYSKQVEQFFVGFYVEKNYTTIKIIEWGGVFEQVFVFEAYTWHKPSWGKIWCPMRM